MPRAAGIILYCERLDRVLLVKRSADDYWSIPGGRIEAGETPEQAAARELEEETQFSPPALWMLQVVGDNRGYRVFVCDVDDCPVPMLDKEHTAFLWAERTNLPDEMYPGFEPMLDYV